MFPRKYRIRKKKEFESVFKSGKTIKGDFFLAKMIENNLPFPRFAFAVPSKLEKRAVKRNRIKRIFREAVRSLLPLIRPGVDIVFIIRKQNNLGFRETKEEIEKRLKKERVIT